MVEAAYVELKDHLVGYLSERFVPPALLSVRVANRHKKETANAVLKYQNQVCSDCQQMPETKDFRTKLFNHFLGLN